MTIQPSRIALFAALAMFGGPAFAQQGAATPAATAPSDEIVVTGQRGAINRARAAERNAASVVNVITSDSIGEFADQNVAESVRRVPGVNVEREEGEGRTMSVRGLPPAWTNVTVNGARIGSVDGDQAFVQLDSIGSELLDSITISKAVTPDMDGDSIGGSVELSSLSAFTRNQDSLRISFDQYFNERADSWGPEYGLSFTKLFMDGKLGIAGSFSMSERDNYGDDLVNDAGLRLYSGLYTDPLVPAPASLAGLLQPEEIDHRLEIGTRKRTGGTLNIEWRPDRNNRAFLRAQYTNLTDDDGRFQNEFETDQANLTSELGTITRNAAQLLFQPPTTRATGGPDIDKQIALAEFVDEIFVTGLGSEHDFGRTSFNWQVDYSEANASSDGQYRGRFRIRNISLDTRYNESGANVTPIAVSTRDPAVASNFVFDELRRSDINRSDDILSLKADLEREYELGGVDAAFKIGGKVRARDISRDTDVFSFNPQSSAFNAVPDIARLRGALGTLPLFTPNSAIMNVGFFPERNAARARFDETFRAVRGLITPRLVETFGADVTIEERTNAVYGMTTLDFSETLSVVAGVRVEQTEMATQGFFMQLDSDDNPIPAPGISLLDLGTVSQEYTEALPGIHVTWRPTQTIDVRASYNRGLQRPDFLDFANRQTYNFVDQELSAGNPYLEPLTADQFDIAFGWFPNPNTAIQISAYHKAIENFFVEYSGTINFAGNPIRVPTGLASTPLDIELVVNGGEATVTGVELGYSQSFTFLPGVLSGLFVQANVTFAESEASAPNILARSFRLPNQAEVLGNVSIGWENDFAQFRIAANHTGEALNSVSSNLFEDVNELAVTTVDFTGQINVGERAQVTFEASNLTEARDEYAFAGTQQSGPIFRQVEDFGRTFTAGLKLRF